ncbi:MAG: toxin YoeB [Bacteroidetes bacterium RIFOXYA12_FULL_35_11]|nr:MAG: toxin YoeB [Bacteroidetes bacterium GWF2_35_48]OFY74834.1 MAG: toxin YoeB [Bacteroidetes bacterium RIFOXYA12_FULL_35_11]
MRKVIFKPIALEQYAQWTIEDKKVFDKICNLIEETVCDPFKGIGKPEPLKHQLKGYWSRRITKEHRLVYQITSDAIIVISCKYHY